MNQLAIDVRNLEIEVLGEPNTSIRPVRDISFRVARGEFLAIVGESGAGKSMTAAALLGFKPMNATLRGSINVLGHEVTSMTTRDLRKMRGNRIAMVFQEPMTALNPLRTVGYQLVEAVRTHRHLKVREARRLAVEALEQVGIAQAHTRFDSYPHEFSGGMRQRVLIAMAIINEPEVLVADEPTTALDVTVQAQVLEVLQRVREERGLAVVFVTHDLGIVASMADRVLVMYAGRIVEEARTSDLFGQPRMPYTAGLLSSVPWRRVREERLRPIPGSPPSPADRVNGCRFSPRCPVAEATCSLQEPELEIVGDVHAEHRAACCRAAEVSSADLMEAFDEASSRR